MKDTELSVTVTVSGLQATWAATIWPIKQRGKQRQEQPVADLRGRNGRCCEDTGKWSQWLWEGYFINILGKEQQI